ncbi:MAG: type I glutamate--ammonia ligase, partial [Clostridia bacterium]|nr:type I glutamate--ammonia ligase [Clostridia bacterium]
RPLPRQLNEALNELQADPVIRSAIGPYIFDRWLKTKAAEWEEYEREIHPWEWKRYLR